MKTAFIFVATLLLAGCPAPRPSAETLRLVRMCEEQGYRPELVDGNRNVICHRDDPWPTATAACENHGGKASMRTVDGPVALVTCRDGHSELVE